MFDRQQDHPDTRIDELLSEAVDDGLVVYDRRSDTAHWLDASAAAVWQLANGERTVAEIADESGLGEPTVAEVLIRLHGLDLMIEKPDGGVSRRVVLGRMAKVGGAAVIISSIAVPSAMAANSKCTKLPCSGHSEDRGGSCAAAKSAATAVCTGQVPACGPCQNASGTCTRGDFDNDGDSDYLFNGFCT